MKRFLTVLIASMFLASAAYAAEEKGQGDEKKAAAKEKSKGDEKKAAAKEKSKGDEKKADTK
jgi:Ni/Co efflux regulator RcnB